jgi:hypothetical protein
MQKVCGAVARAALMLVLAGCGGQTDDGQIGATRQMFAVPLAVQATEVAGWRLSGVDVAVPDSLTVSTDPKVQFPDARIVWWEDPPGDRRAQVDRIMTGAIGQGAAGLDGTRPVRLRAQVLRFHAVTPQALYGPWYAWHDISFTLAVHDAATGAVLARAERIDADIEALRNTAATSARARGITQASMISGRVAEAVAAWLASGPASGD